MSRIKLNVIRKQSEFTIVHNSVIRNKDLTPTAKILLIFLLGCDQENFTINTKSLSKSIGVGVSAITSASKNLQSYGYLVISKLSYGKCIWEIFEDPHLEKPDMEKPDMDNQDALKRTNNKKEKNNKKEVLNFKHKVYDFVLSIYPDGKKSKAEDGRLNFIKATSGLDIPALEELSITIQNDLELRIKSCQDMKFFTHIQNYVANKMWEQE